MNYLGWGKRELVLRYRLFVILLFHFEEFPLPLSYKERSCYFIVALHGPSILLFHKLSKTKRRYMRFA